MEEVRGAAERFARSLGKGDTIVVAPFNTKLGSITGPTKSLGAMIVARMNGSSTSSIDAGSGMSAGLWISTNSPFVSFTS